MQKRALVTGASGGIGAAIARRLAGEGCEVIVNYNNSKDMAESLAAEIGGIAYRADVADAGAVDAMFEAVGGVDILVCNAGISLTKLIQDTTLEEWRRIMDVNAGGVFNACKAAIPHMIHNKYGRIITISSMWGRVGASCEAAYSASKAAVIGLTKALCQELGPSGITVNCVAPGVIDTQMNAVHSPETMAALAGETPVGRIGTVDDVAQCVAFLASDKAGFITGQVIGADGGFIL